MKLTILRFGLAKLQAEEPQKIDQIRKTNVQVEIQR